jgi:hypothetical protein
VPAGTAVTVTYMTQLTRSTGWLSQLSGPTWVEQTTVYRTKHTMGSYDPEVVGVQGYCKSATYTSRPVFSQ